MRFFETIKSFLRDKSYRNLLITTNIILAIGTVSFHFIEGWSWIDSLYFSVITLTTIGYGDFSPATELGKLFALGYIVVGVGVILNFIQVLHQHYGDRRNNQEGDSTDIKGGKGFFS